MCGIVGIARAGNAGPVDAGLLTRMNDQLFHRGPDGDGIHIDGPIGLGHRRLSIIDLDAGQQPMFSDDRRICVVFNGEIYNYRELATELRAKGAVFQTESDTEVLIHGWLAWGHALLERLNGMFAFALWDRQQQELFLARDRLGIKPLYYARTRSGTLLFASELKALTAHPELDTSLDQQGITDYFTVGYLPDPRTAYASVRKLPPAHFLTLDCGSGEHAVQSYWDVCYPDRWHDGRNEQQLTEELLEQLKRAVDLQLVADVPLGAFLSGGVDSSAVVAMMAELVPGSVRTCSIGFDDPDFDESGHAATVAALLGTDHIERTVHIDDFDLVDQLVDIYDEPFADSSAIPTFRLCGETRQIVKVALSGDGGDENFAGYRRYRLFSAEESVRGLLPAGLRRLLFGPLGRYYPKLDWAPRVLRGKTTFQALARDSVSAYLHGVSIASEEVRQLLFSSDFRAANQHYRTDDLFHEHVRGMEFADPLSMVQYLDFKTYLPGDILTKVDRASMAHSLEVRVPLLDHKFVEWIANVPVSQKLRRGEGKYIFKRSLEGRLPDDILYRQKMGFAVPLQRWFRGPLAARLQSLATSRVLRDSGVFSPRGLQQIVDRHVSGRRDYSAVIWALLMFEGFLGRR